MKKRDKEDYTIVSELSHHYMEDDDWKLTPKQAKFVIAGVCIVFVFVLAFVIYKQAQDYEQTLVEEKRLEAQLEASGMNFGTYRAVMIIGVMPYTGRISLIPQPSLMSKALNNSPSAPI